MKQAEQQHIRRAVGVEVVNDGIDPLDRGVNPGFDLAQEVDSVGGGAVVIGLRVSTAAGGLESTEDIAGDTASAIVDLLFGPLGLGRCRLDELLAWKAPSRLWSHLVQADDYAAGWRRGVELLNAPLFFYGGKACCRKARCSSSARYAAGLRRKRERRTLAWWRCFNRPRVSRHLARSTAARS